MNRDAAKLHIEAIEAFANGQIIEYFNVTSQQWIEVDRPLFSIDTKYRVKKAAKTFYVNVYGKENESLRQLGTIRHSMQSAIDMHTSELYGKPYIKTIKLMEIEDDE